MMSLQGVEQRPLSHRAYSSFETIELVVYDLRKMQHGVDAKFH